VKWLRNSTSDTEFKHKRFSPIIPVNGYRCAFSKSLSKLVSLQTIHAEEGMEPNSLPPSTKPFWARDREGRGDPVERAWRGVITVSPALGMLAAYATTEVMSEKKRPLGWPTFKTGATRGFIYWLPFGTAAALYYSGEYLCRPPAAAISHSLQRWLPQSLHRIVHAPSIPSAFDDDLPSSSLSKALAGGGTGFAVSTAMFLLRVRGFRGLSSVPLTSGLAAAAAVAMPDYESISRR
jgi:hypothetical protein